MAENILVIAAHSDDQILGAGGTTSKYTKEGNIIKTIVFFSGEESHLHFKEEIIVSTRMEESLKADKVIGGKGVNFFNYIEKSFKQSYYDEAKKNLERIILEFKPGRIFTHSPKDAHPGHRKVSNLVLETVDKINNKIEVYAFDIWNPFRWDKKKFPRLFVDISETFSTKTKAIKCFKSQFGFYGFINMFALTLMYVKDFINGRKNKTKYAEVFYKLR